MDRDTLLEVRTRLLAVRGILRVWKGPEFPETPLAVDWMLGLVAQILGFSRLSRRLSSEMTLLGATLMDVLAHQGPSDSREVLKNWVNSLLELVDTELAVEETGRRVH